MSQSKVYETMNLALILGYTKYVKEDLNIPEGGTIDDAKTHIIIGDDGRQLDDVMNVNYIHFNSKSSIGPGWIFNSNKLNKVLTLLDKNNIDCECKTLEMYNNNNNIVEDEHIDDTRGMLFNDTWGDSI